MRLDIASILLLPPAISASFIDDIFAEPTSPAIAAAAAPSATSYLDSLDHANAVHEAQIEQPAPIAQAPVQAPHAFIPRGYNPNPGPQPVADAPMQKRAVEPRAPLPEPQGAVVTAPAQGVAATAAVGPTQYPTITTLWLPSNIPGQPGGATYLPFTYIQTFAAVPEQWPSPGVGSIGYGSGSKAKRDEAAERRELEERLAELAGMKMEKTMEKRGMVLMEVEVRDLGDGKTEYMPKREVKTEQEKEKRSAAERTAARVAGVFGLFGVVVAMGMMW